MLYFWLANIFFSGLGLFLFPVYGADKLGIWPVVLGLGIVCAWIGYLRMKSDGGCSQRGQMWLALIPIAAGIIAFHLPYSMPLYLYAAGLIIWTAVRHRVARSLAAALLLAGLISGLQTGLVILYFKVAARFHEANFLTPLFYLACKALGMACAYSQDTVFVQTSQEVLSLVTTWEKLGLFFLLNFLTGGMVLLWCTPGCRGFLQKIKCAGVLLSVIIAYGLLRYLLLALAFIDFKSMEFYWEPSIVFSTFLLLPIAAWRALPFRCALCVPLPSLAVSRQNLALGATALLLFGSLACFSWFHDPGLPKQGRILIDEYYSNWEWTDRKLDTAWYGVQSVYNYYCFGDYLGHFYKVSALREPATEEILGGCDILIIKTPTRAFSDAEIERIANFVSEGGGLFLIGDHTNVFGTSTNLNPLAGRFGIRFNADATYDLRTSDLHLHEHNTIFRHPVVAQMPYFLFATSCSLSAPLTADDIMTASNLKTIYMDYSRGGFFPDKLKEHNFTFGLFLQSVGLQYGKGRVIAFADSTCFSNFYMYLPGKPEYSLGVCDWLNRSNLYGKPVKLLSAAVMGCAAVMLAFCIIRRRRTKSSGGLSVASQVLFWGMLGIAGGALLCSAMANRLFRLPAAHTPLRTVGFEQNVCKLMLPDRQLVHNPDLDYHTFYVWTQRLGYVPQVFSFGKGNLEEYETIVLMNPIGSFSSDDLAMLEGYVSRGGRLLVIDHPRGKNSRANEILARFGLRIIHEAYAENAPVFDGERRAGTLAACAPIEGGTALLHLHDGRPVASFEKRGAGMVAAVACSTSFTNKAMGETETVPNEQQQFLYRFEFWLLQSLMQKHFTSFSEFAH